jgi:RNA polymerase sigma-70 factor (ECF subfamily)
MGKETTHLEALFREHSQAVLGYCLRRGAGPEDAAEIVSEVMLVAWRRLADVPAGPEARFWMLGTARLALANQSRSERRRTKLSERLRGELEASAAQQADNELTDLVMTAIRALPEQDREVLCLATWEDLRPSEIALVLSIPPETARTRLHRARRRLRDELEPALSDSASSAAVEQTYAARKEAS